MTCFFVSYNRADKAWAEWIAWTLEEAEYTAIIQAWDFRPGGNFVLDMQRAAVDSDKTLVVLSEDYLNAEFTQPEWAAAFAEDPRSLKRKIIPIRVRACQPSGLLRPLVYVDLVGLEPEAAQQAVLAALPERLKPDTAPPFPQATAPRDLPEQPEFPGPSPSKPWNVPYERNAFFTGREQVLHDLHQQLHQDKAAALSQTQAISGLGGIGKTQTAVEYACRYRQDYEAVFWVRAETELELSTGFVAIAQLLNLPQQNAPDPNDTIEAVKRWLARYPGWLLIFDNADQPKRLKSFCPRQASGHILLTSRAQTFDSLGLTRPVSLSKMSAEEAVAFLVNRTGRDCESTLEQAAAQTLASKLGYLPLALEQAGAYILAQQISFQGYLKSYQIRRLSLLKKSSPIAGNYPESVATTWALNFREVEAASPAAADLLRVSAFLSPDAIPYELFERGASQLGEVLAGALAEMSADPIAFTETLAPLTRYSLVRTDPALQSYSIARLVQAVVRDGMLQATANSYLQQAANAISYAYPGKEFKHWEVCSQLLPHWLQIKEHAEQRGGESEAVGTLLNQAGLFLKAQGHYSEAELLWEKTLQIRQRILGEEHPDVAESFNNLALLYRKQGKYQDAENHLKQALYISISLLGENHFDVATTINNLALNLCDQGDFEQASSLFRKALDIQEKISGEDFSAEKSNTLNNLARCYYFLGDHDNAESLLLKNLSARIQLFGQEHPNVAESLNNLAWFYDKQRYFEKAEPYLRKALELRKCLLGEGHPDVAQSFVNMGVNYAERGLYSEAEDFVVKGLEILEKNFENGHRRIYSARSTLRNIRNEIRKDSFRW